MTANRVSNHYARNIYLNIFLKIAIPKILATWITFQSCKILAKLLQNTCNNYDGGLQTGTYFDFFYKNIYFQEHQWAFAIHFFSFTAVHQTRIYFFVSLFLQKIRCLLQVSGKLGFGICLIIPNVSLKFFPAYQNIEVAFERYHKSTLFVQTCDEYSTSPPVVKRRKTFSANSLIIALLHKRFSKNLTASSKQRNHKISF